MMRTPLVMFLALFVGAAFVRPSTAQSGGPEDDAGGVAQLFGQGNGIHGTVTAAANGSFNVRTDENESYKVFYGPNTRIMKDRQPMDAGSIHMGDMLLAAGQVDRKAKTVGAVFLYDVDASQARKAQAAFGKTWTVGKVQAIHNLKIVIERIDDKQTQTVAVDENTSFRRHNESVTLGEVKIGDFISAQGKLENGNFVAATLRIMEPKAGNPGFSAGSPEEPSWDGGPQ